MLHLELLNKERKLKNVIGDCLDILICLWAYVNPQPHLGLKKTLKKVAFRFDFPDLKRFVKNL